MNVYSMFLHAIKNIEPTLYKWKYKGLQKTSTEVYLIELSNI